MPGAWSPYTAFCYTGLYFTSCCSKPQENMAYDGKMKSEV